MIKYTCTLLMILFGISCSNQTRKGSSDISIKQIVLKSRIPINLIPYSGSVSYRPTYIGVKNDTINIKPDTLDSLYFNFSHNSYKISKDSNDIRVYIDTTQIIPNLSSLTAPPVLHETDTLNNQNTYCKSYPVFIENISSDTLHIGSTNGLPIHLQVLSPNNTWVRTNRFLPGCGTGVIPYFLTPRSILIFPHPISHGNMKTTFRFAFGYKAHWNLNTDFVYSNEFYGRIDSSFFDHYKI